MRAEENQNPLRQVRACFGLYGGLLVVEGFLCSRCDLLSSSMLPLLGEPALRISIGLTIYILVFLGGNSPKAALLVMIVAMFVSWMGDLVFLHAYVASGQAFASLRMADVTLVLAASTYLLVRSRQVQSGTPPTAPSGSVHGA